MKILLGLILLVPALLLLALVVTGRTYLLEAIRTILLKGRMKPDIYDFKNQHTRVIKKSQAQTWPLSDRYNEVPMAEEIIAHHEVFKSTAFLVVQNGKILSEHYMNGGGADRPSTIWSCTKSFVSMAILKAVQDGLIDSVDDPVSKYIPEWKVEQNPPVTLRHLGSMSAGLYWEEMDQSPISLIAKFSFYPELNQLAVDALPAIGSPGEIQHYNSGGTQLLAVVLSRVLKGKNLSDYMSEKFWQPLGMENNGLWVLDKENGDERAFGGMVTTARDLSKAGQMILNNGQWNGETILTEEDIALIQTTPYKNHCYNYGFWTGEVEGVKFYNFQGFAGQYCIMIPEYNLLVTRMGHKLDWDEILEKVPTQVFTLAAEGIRIAKESAKLK